ncbi:MAG: hypothetical protein Kow00127_11050 [Bacteroidales bacterium]
MKTKNTILTLFMLLSGTYLFAQKDYHVEFTYDAAGNRTERHIIELKKQGKDNNPESKSTRAKNYTQALGQHQITIFPNPVKEQLTVKITNPELSNATRLELLSLPGKRMYSKKVLRESTQVDLSKLPAGTYILKIILGREVTNWKVVKE